MISMGKAFTAVPVAKDVFWVGAIDWAIRDFHGYMTNRGTTYNAYLVLGEQPILVDTVKAPFMGEMMERISSVLDPSSIKFVISNHSEMDHSGSLPRVMDIVKPERVYASVMGRKALEAHYRIGSRITEVHDGESVNIGGREVRFMETRMLHWPDSMFSYLPAEKILFSNDAFGMHLASEARFADETDRTILREEAKKYFANILLPYADLVTGLFGRLESAAMECAIVAPDHGPVYRTEEDIRSIFDLWKGWALQVPSRKAVVTWDTMWGSTDLMARAIAEGLSEGGVEVKMFPLRASPRSEVATALLGAGALVVGSPTLNNGLFPTVADILTYLKGLRPKNFIGASFGSYGWSGEAVGHIETILGEMKAEPAGDRVKLLYVPDEAGTSRCREFGVSLAARIKEWCDRFSQGEGKE
jgi:flavorubredoxin